MTSFSDDFNRADSTTVGNGWVEVAEDWSIVSNRLAPGSTGGTGIIRCGTAMATDDNSAQATIAVAAAVSCGVWCRWDSVFGNGYLWRNDGTSWDLFRNVSGSFTALATFAGAAANGDVAKVQAVGTTIKGFVNGVERASVTDSGITTGKNTGMRCAASGTVRYDDFTAADVTTGHTLALGRATETNTATALARSKARALGRATATDTASPLGRAKALAITRAIETATATVLGRAKAAALGRAIEADSVLALVRSKTRAVGRAVETATAGVLGRAKAATLARAVETDSGRPIDVASPNVVVLGRAIEIDTAHHLVTDLIITAADPRLTVRPNDATLTATANRAVLTMGGTE